MAPATAKLGTIGIDLTARDESVDPGDDVFRYVNGAWLERTGIPDDRSRYGAFNVLSDQAEKRVGAIIEEAAAKNDPSEAERRIGDLFAAYTDLDAIEAKGLKPALPHEPSSTAPMNRFRGKISTDGWASARTSVT